MWQDNTMARRIRFLPVDMPNMDLKVDQPGRPRRSACV